MSVRPSTRPVSAPASTLTKTTMIVRRASDEADLADETESTTIKAAMPGLGREAKEALLRGQLPERVGVRIAIKTRIVNRLGLHARPAMSFVDLASEYRSAVTVRKGDQEVDGKSIMQMMMLAATQGTELEIVCEGVRRARCPAAP